MPSTRYGHCFFGVDYSIPPTEIFETALADGKNVLIDDSGLIIPRGGSVKLNNVSLASRITSFFEYSTGSTRSQLCSYSTKIAVYNSTTGEFDDVITGLTDDKMVQWVNFQGKAICVNEGADVPQYYTAAADGDLEGSPPQGLTIAVWANRLWFGGNTTNVGDLDGSAINDPTDYTGAAATATDAGTFTVGDQNDQITGLFPYFDNLLVGKKNNLYRVVASDPAKPTTDITGLAIKPLYSRSGDNVGFTSPWAITQVGNDVIFLDGYDIKSITGIQEYGDIEYTSIIPHIRGYLKDTVDQDYLQYTHFFHYKKNQQIWVTIPTGAATHFVFVLDYKFKKDTDRYSFYPLGELVVNCFGGVENGEVTDIYYGDETGYVRKLDIGTNDDGAAIDSYFVKMISGNNPQFKELERHELRKQFHYSDTYINPNGGSLTMTPYYAIGLMDSEQVRTSGNYTALSAETVSNWKGTGTKQKRVRFYGLSGKTMALKWSHSTVAQSYTIYPSMVNFEWKSKNSII